MKISAYVAFIYGAIVIIGGIIGFILAGSQISLWTGSLFGLLLIISSYVITRNAMIGLYSVLTLAGILSFFFIYRYAITGSWMPSGMMMLVSVVAFLVTAITAKFHNSNSKSTN